MKRLCPVSAEPNWRTLKMKSHTLQWWVDFHFFLVGWGGGACWALTDSAVCSAPCGGEQSRGRK